MAAILSVVCVTGGHEDSLLLLKARRVHTTSWNKIVTCHHNVLHTSRLCTGARTLLRSERSRANHPGGTGCGRKTGYQTCADLPFSCCLDGVAGRWLWVSSRLPSGGPQRLGSTPRFYWIAKARHLCRRFFSRSHVNRLMTSTLNNANSCFEKACYFLSLRIVWGNVSFWIRAWLSSVKNMFGVLVGWLLCYLFIHAFIKLIYRVWKMWVTFYLPVGPYSFIYLFLSLGYLFDVFLFCLSASLVYPSA